MPGDVLAHARSPSTSARRRDRRRGRATAAVTTGSVRPTSPRSIDRHRIGLDEARPDAVAKRRGGRPAHGAGERRRPRRRRLVRRVRAARHRRPAPPPRSRRPHRPHPGRRDDRRHRHGQRRPVRRPRRPRASRCRTTTPCSPARRACRTTARRTGCSSSPSGCGCRSCSSPRAAAVAPATPTARASSGLDCLAFLLFARAVRARAAGRHQRRLLLRRQRRDPRLLRRRHRHRRLEHRDGRAGDDRGRRARRVRADGGRPDRRAAGQRRRRHRRRRRGRGGRASAKQYLSYFQGRCRRGSAPTRRCCATSSPTTACAATTCARSIEPLFDTGSVLELRRDFGLGMVTALARVEGRPVGVIANNPTTSAARSTATGADKAARFLQLCDAFDIPLVTLVRHARDDGRPRGRDDRPRAPLLPAVRDRRQHHGADRQRSCCASATGSAPRR